MKHLLLTALLTLLPVSTWADAITGKVVKVTDGDTINVLVDGREQVKVRLGGIDAPESSQPFGRASRDYLADAIAGKEVTVSFTKTDRYGRVIGKVLLEGQDMNLRQVQGGYAWWYEYYKRDQSSADQRAYSSAEQQARSRGLGLWSEPNPINPYDWRQGKRQARNTPTPQDGTCGTKRYCSEMTSCQEARFYLNQCGLTRLDGDGDGTPCESLCG